MSMARHYQHLKSLQRAGVFDENLWSERKEHPNIALECPACPQSGRNLPMDWKTRVNKSVYNFFYDNVGFI